jgi:hypothetical protein
LHGPQRLDGGHNRENWFYMCLYRTIFKNLLLWNHRVRKTQIYIIASLHSSKSSILHHGPWGLGHGYIVGKTVLTCVYIGKIFQNFLRNHQVRIAWSLLYKQSLVLLSALIVYYRCANCSSSFYAFQTLFVQSIVNVFWVCYRLHCIVCLYPPWLFMLKSVTLR